MDAVAFSELTTGRAVMVRSQGRWRPGVVLERKKTRVVIDHVRNRSGQRRTHTFNLIDVRAQSDA